MKKIYKIPKSQLIVIIIFGVIGELVLLVSWGDCYNGCGILGFLSIFVPFLLTFYLVGWIHHNKNKKNKNVNLKFCSKCGEKNQLDSKHCFNCGELIIS